MADPILQPVVATGKKPPSAVTLPESVALSLTVVDADSIAEIIQYSEGRERIEYALNALRIGLLSLRYARGQVDADLVRREGENLLRELAGALQQHRNEVSNGIEGALRDYFDPSNGKFQERIDRLIKQDGELERVLQRQVGSNGSELEKTLSTYVGDRSPLMKLLDPGESTGIVQLTHDTVFELLTAERKRILSEFSLDNKQGALSRLIIEITDESGKLKKDLAGEIGELVKEFSLDHEDSALSRLVRKVEFAQQTLTKEFSLDNEQSTQ